MDQKSEKFSYKSQKIIKNVRKYSYVLQDKIISFRLLKGQIPDLTRTFKIVLNWLNTFTYLGLK